MHALIVVAHHDPQSLTHSLASQIAEGVSLADPGNSFEIADLSAQAFDPRFTAADLAVHHREEPPPADVAAEQARIVRALVERVVVGVDQVAQLRQIVAAAQQPVDTDWSVWAQTDRALLEPSRWALH